MPTIQDKAKEAMHRAQEAINTVQEAFEGDPVGKIKGGAQQARDVARDVARDTWADTKVAMGMEKPRWTSQHPYLLNTLIALAALLFVLGAGYAITKFARKRLQEKRMRDGGRPVVRPSTAGSHQDAPEEEDEASAARRRRVGSHK